MNQSFYNPHQAALVRTFKLKMESRKTQCINKNYSNYIKLGFIQKSDSELDLQLTYNLCSDMFKESVKSFIFRGHLQSKYLYLLSKKPFKYFQRMHKNMKKQLISWTKMFVKHEILWQTSQMIALQIAKTKKLLFYTTFYFLQLLIEEELVPCMYCLSLACYKFWRDIGVAGCPDIESNSC